jgi:hypothetical protein
MNDSNQMIIISFDHLTDDRRHHLDHLNDKLSDNIVDYYLSVCITKVFTFEKTHTLCDWINRYR